MNILVSPLPASVEIGGASVPIKTGFRTGIQVARTIESGLPADIMFGTVLRLYFPQLRLATEEATERAMWFFRGGQPAATKRRGGRQNRRTLDWDHDAGAILADFRREYGIDLADPRTQMHWWVFLAYFEGLSSDSEIKTAMYYRGATKPRGMSKVESEHFERMRRAYALPPKTLDEAVTREAAMWGDS